MRAIEQKILRELAKPAAKRTVGHDRDPSGYFVLASLLTSDEAWDTPVIDTHEIPAAIDCLTCRFHRDDCWSAQPCMKCLDEYSAEKPYPMWRRG